MYAGPSAPSRTASGPMADGPMSTPAPPLPCPSSLAAPSKVATLTFDGKTIELPLIRDVYNNVFVDIRTLHPRTGICTYDPGFTSTAACDSSITYANGDQGLLQYRGYPIEQLAKLKDAVDVSYLLLEGELPTSAQKAVHRALLARHSMVHEKLIQFFNGFKSDAHPMGILVGVVGSLATFYPFPLETLRDPGQRRAACLRLIAKLPTLAAIAYKTSIGEPIVYPREDLTYTENFLHMLFSRPTAPYVVDPKIVRALDVFFVLHADHEQNASTSTVRIAGSSQANPYACIAAGISSLWGPAHGGANEAVILMLEAIGNVENIPAFLEQAKSKDSHVRLMGFGHRVYKSCDPRAAIMKTMCTDVLDAMEIEDPKLKQLLAVAKELERIALADDYFRARKLYPNVDFYSGICLRAIGFPVSMFTVLFAVARSAGWSAQWLEMASEAVPKISRPRQVYTGKTLRPVT